MELSTNYLPLLICISLIVIGATLIYMYFIKKTAKNNTTIPQNKQVQINNNKNIEYEYEQPEEEEEEQEQEQGTTDSYTNGTFRIKPKHIMNDDENDEEGGMYNDDTTTIVENFNAPKTRDGYIRPSMGDEQVLSSRNSNSLSFIDKLQKRFDSTS